MWINGSAKCTKTVVMDRLTGEDEVVAFKEGKSYKANVGTYVTALDEQGYEHCIGRRYGDSFLSEHFTVTLER